MPSTSVNNRSVYTRWIRNGTGLVNLYVNGEALKVLEDNSDKPKFIWLLESREIIPDQYKFIEDNCLVHQSFVKNPDMTISQLVQEAIAKLGENITINRFVRFALGEQSN